MVSRSSIPQPPSRPIIGHLLEATGPTPVQRMMDLARTYGPVYWLEAFGEGAFVISSQALVDEVCNEGRFKKCVHSTLVELRALGGDGLFTAFDDEPNWGKAHRILMPAFGPLGVRSMFDKMLDIAEQMLVRWERFGTDAPVDVSDNMTRLTLDTIALCAFDARLNSFYKGPAAPLRRIDGQWPRGGIPPGRPTQVSDEHHAAQQAQVRPRHRGHA